MDAVLVVFADLDQQNDSVTTKNKKTTKNIWPLGEKNIDPNPV